MIDIIAQENAVLRAITEHGGADNPSAFLACNEGNSTFTVPDRPGVVVYRTAGDYLVQFGGPFAPAGHYEALLAAFLAFAERQRRTVVAVQLQRSDAEVYARTGFTVNQVGASYAVELSRLSLQGTRFMQLRNKISRARRAGLTVLEDRAGDWFDAMRELDQVWLRGKGEHARPLEYLVGQYGGPMQKHRRLFVGVIAGELAGYVTYSPVFGGRPGWLHDLSRRTPGGTPGVVEAINLTAIDQFRAEGASWLHFGFTPFTSLDDILELPGHSPGFSQFMRLLWQYGEAVYPAQSQLAYKRKWAPDVTLPEYVAFHGTASVAGFAHVFRACNAF
jgi:lysylphosphatidylglycerol synthetase-like protein (DUF2156 family)